MVTAGAMFTCRFSQLTSRSLLSVLATGTVMWLLPSSWCAELGLVMEDNAPPFASSLLILLLEKATMRSQDNTTRTNNLCSKRLARIPPAVLESDNGSDDEDKARTMRQRRQRQANNKNCTYFVRLVYFMHYDFNYV